MVEENGKVPVGIVNTVVNKIAEFTKEVEILRAQLPKEQSTIEYRSEITNSVSKLSGKIDDTDKSINILTNCINGSIKTFRIVFSLIAMAVVLAFVAAQGMMYYERNKIKLDTKMVIEKTVEETIDNYIKKHIIKSGNNEKDDKDSK